MVSPAERVSTLCLLMAPLLHASRYGAFVARTLAPHKSALSAGRGLWGVRGQARWMMAAAAAGGPVRWVVVYVAL